MDEIVDVAMDEVITVEFEQRHLRATGIGTADPNGSGIVLQTWYMEQLSIPLCSGLVPK
jgi:hypothetical protein